MGQVTFAINGRSYRIGCADGEEKRLAELARDVAARVDRLVMEFGQVGEARLLLMAALLASDELFDVRADLDALVAEAAERLHAAAADAALDSGPARAAGRQGGRGADAAPASRGPDTRNAGSHGDDQTSATAMPDAMPDAGPDAMPDVGPAAVPEAGAAPAAASARPEASAGKPQAASGKAHRGQRVELPGRARSA